MVNDGMDDMDKQEIDVIECAGGARILHIRRRKYTDWSTVILYDGTATTLPYCGPLEAERKP
jgi:hypothetical protein